MVEVRFINDTTPIEVTSDEQETQIEVTSETQETEIEVGGLRHNDLSGRDSPNQHSISAITGLQEALVEVSDKTFVYEQGIASDVWVVEHNLNKYPSVFILDSSGAVQIPNEIFYDSENAVTITFLAPFAGKAIFN